MSKITHTIGSLLLDLFETIAIGLSIFFIIYLFLTQPHQVNGKSMVPTLQNNQFLLTNKIVYRFEQPQRGDIIIFHAPSKAKCPKNTGCDFIKRIIGLPGETLELKDNHFYINGKKLEEDYISQYNETETSNYLIKKGKVTLGSDEYFVCGDNRIYSSDSRAWGPIQRSDIVGKAFFSYWPPELFGRVEHD